MVRYNNSIWGMNQLMNDDPTKDILTRVVSAIESKDFFRSILSNDTFDDWNLAKNFAEFLIEIEPSEIMGHALAARAYRHLDDKVRARKELEECQRLGTRIGANHSEADLFKSVIAREVEELKE